MMGNKKTPTVGYWHEAAQHVDSVGQVYKEYKCSECGFVTILQGRKTCPACLAEMAGVR